MRSSGNTVANAVNMVFSENVEASQVQTLAYPLPSFLRFGESDQDFKTIAGRCSVLTPRQAACIL